MTKYLMHTKNSISQCVTCHFVDIYLIVALSFVAKISNGSRPFSKGYNAKYRICIHI